MEKDLAGLGLTTTWLPETLYQGRKLTKREVMERVKDYQSPL